MLVRRRGNAQMMPPWMKPNERRKGSSMVVYGFVKNSGISPGGGMLFFHLGYSVFYVIIKCFF